MQAYFNTQLERYSLGAMYVTNPVNVRYLTGFSGSFGVVVILHGRTILITDARYTEEAKRTCQGTEVMDMTQKDWEEILLQVKNIGYESDHMTVQRFERLQHKFHHARWVSSSVLLNNARRRKNAFEITAISTASQIANKCLEPILKSLKEGVSEQEIAKKLEISAIHEGADTVSFAPIVAFEENAAVPHHHPSTKKLKKGDTILIDFGVKYHGYCSDMTRTYFFKQSTTEKENYFALVLEAQKKSIEQIKIGAHCKELYESTCNFFNRYEVRDFFTHSLGHGVGLEIHEAPFFKKESHETIEEWDVITCEPGLYFPGKFGIRIEDVGVVKKDGFHVLTDVPRAMCIL